MPSPSHRYWFPAKRYGWGWGFPSTWQGWVVAVVWFALVTVGSALLAPRSLPLFTGFIIAITALLVIVCYVKGEPPRWRWGNDK